jgi:hypothetical protein
VVRHDNLSPARINRQRRHSDQSRLCQLIAKAGNPSLGVQEMVTKFELQGQEGMVRKIIQNYGYQFIQSTGMMESLGTGCFTLTNSSKK